MDHQASMPWYKFLEFQENLSSNIKNLRNNDHINLAKINKNEELLIILDSRLAVLEAEKHTKASVDSVLELMKRLDVIEAEKQIPSSASKEIQLLKSRLERIELLVGLKREPVITNLPDAPRIS